MKKSGVQLIAEERSEHFTKHNHTVEKDVKFNSEGQLAYAASVMTINNADLTFINPPKNWERVYWDKLIRKSYEERLVKAGSFIAAEIDRLNF